MWGFFCSHSHLCGFFLPAAVVSFVSGSVAVFNISCLSLWLSVLKFSNRGWVKKKPTMFINTVSSPQWFSLVAANLLALLCYSKNAITSQDSTVFLSRNKTELITFLSPVEEAGDVLTLQHLATVQLMPICTIRLMTVWRGWDQLRRSETLCLHWESCTAANQSGCYLAYHVVRQLVMIFSRRFN